MTATPVGSGSPVSQTFNSTATTETLSGLTNGDPVQRVGGGDHQRGDRAVGECVEQPDLCSAVRRPSPRLAHTTFTAGSAGSFTVTTSGSPTPSISETGALPSGVTFTDNGDGTATLAGTPAAGTGGTYPISIDAGNGISPDGTQTFTLTVDEAPSITSGDSATFSEGDPGSSTITTTGFPTASLSESGTLPTA